MAEARFLDARLDPRIKSGDGQDGPVDFYPLDGAYYRHARWGADLPAFMPGLEPGIKKPSLRK